MPQASATLSVTIQRKCGTLSSRTFTAITLRGCTPFPTLKFIARALACRTCGDTIDWPPQGVACFPRCCRLTLISAPAFSRMQGRFCCQGTFNRSNVARIFLETLRFWRSSFPVIAPAIGGLPCATIVGDCTCWWLMRHGRRKPSAKTGHLRHLRRAGLAIPIKHVPHWTRCIGSMLAIPKYGSRLAIAPSGLKRLEFHRGDRHTARPRHHLVFSLQ